MDVTFSTFLGQIVSNPVLAVTVILALGAIFVNGWTDAPNAHRDLRHYALHARPRRHSHERRIQLPRRAHHDAL